MDAGGYTDPAAFGFAIPPGFLKMRLFPFHEIANDTDYLTNILELKGDLIGNNMKTMPGMILNISIGSPPLVNVGDKLFQTVYETDPAFLNGKSSIYDWISKYVSGICFNVSTTIVSYRSYCVNNDLLPPPPPPGLNIYIDCTENTVLARNIHVGTMLRILLTAPRLFSLIESAVEETKYEAVYDSIIRRLISRFDKSRLVMPMWKVLIMVLYRIVHITQNIDVSKEIWHKQWDENNPLYDALDMMMDAINRGNSSDYNVRIYLIKRRGRLLHDETERIPAHLPADDMPALDSERNLSTKAWLAMSQYYRLMSLFQTSFRIEGHEFDTLSSMIFRDAHASTASSISARYDYEFFQYAEMASEKNIRHKTIMVSTPSDYKLNRHPVINDNTMTFIKPNPIYANIKPNDRNNFTLGVALGVCWFYNSTKEALLDIRQYPVFKMPFIELADHVDEMGRTTKMPSLVDCRDRNNFLSITDEKTFFTYGMDEYIISKFVLNHMFDDSEQFNRVNLLFFSLFWFHSIHKATGDEMYPTMRMQFKMTFDNWRTKNPTVESISLRIFYLRKINEDPSYKYILQPMINCMYGNAFSYRYRQIDPKGMDFLIAPIEEEIINGYQEKFGVNRLDVILDTVARYDRPCYWKTGNRGLYYSPRDPMGKKIIPSNRGASNMLKYVCMNPIESAKCMRGLCEELDGAPFEYNANTGNPLYGGKKKKSKTRKSKSRRKKCTRRKRAIH